MPLQENCWELPLIIPVLNGFKALEHCKALRVLCFSNQMKEFSCNAIVGCDALKTIIYRGTIYEFSCLETPGQTPDLEVVYCTDGQIQFGKDREYYIDTLYFPGTRAQWNETIAPNDWRNRSIAQKASIRYIYKATTGYASLHSRWLCYGSCRECLSNYPRALVAFLICL